MDKSARVFVAGHGGLVGSALVRLLRARGYSSLILRRSAELDLRDQAAVRAFFEAEKPEYVFLAAAKVGGILANNTYKAEFIYDNIAIATNVIDASRRVGVKKLLNLGSSCIFPKFAPQPMSESLLLTGLLEPTNEPYAIAKIAAIKLCRYYNEQYGTNFISLMPSNLYGPFDNFDLERSHVLPAMLRKFHLARLFSEGRLDEILRDLESRPIGFGLTADRTTLEQTLASIGIFKEKIVLWGTGSPFREFLYVDDLAAAAMYFMESKEYREIGEFLNIGPGTDGSIKHLAETISPLVGYRGVVEWDPSKPDGTPKKLLDVSKANRLGWKARTMLEDGLRLTYQWYSER